MGRIIKRYTDEQIDRANRVDVVDYVRSLGFVVEKSGNWYKAKNQGGLYFHRDSNTWHWETHSKGGKGAVSLCMELEQKTWKEAIQTLLNEDMESIRYTDAWVPKPEPEKEFKLPDKNNSYRHVFAYLVKTRGIDADILKQLVEQGYVYENLQHSCVFVGKDSEGVPRHASVRSTNTTGKVFKQDVPGSKKQFSFSISGTSGVVNVFEAPIDAISYMSLQKLKGISMNDSYLSLGGVTEKALVRFLEENPNIEKIRICTDRDEAGEKAVLRINDLYKDQYKITRHRPTHKDFNEDLITYRIDQRQIATEKTASDLFLIKGTCEVLVVCDSPEEVEAYINVYKHNMKTLMDIDYAPDEYYCSSKDVDVVLKENVQIRKLRICTSNTPEGIEAASSISSRYSAKYICDRGTPSAETYMRDWDMMKSIDNTIEETLEQVQEPPPSMEMAYEM